MDKTKSLSLKNNYEPEDDDISFLLDSVPELDSKYSIIRRIGYGTFSTVYLGKTKNSQSNERSHFAIKHITPTSHPSRVYMELKCLTLMGGESNIIEVIMCLRSGNHIILVMPYFSHDTFADYVGNLTVEEICDYLLNLFIALKKVHELNIIHRDVKPTNFLYSRKHRRYALIDFGLAQEVPKGSDQSKKISQSSQINKGNLSLNFPPTPHISLSCPVKRKLALSNVSSPDVFSSLMPVSKKSRLAFPGLDSDKTKIPSSPGNIKLMVVRRSPRKTSSFKTISKENVPLTPNGKETNLEAILKNSPSKHTRMAEASKTTMKASVVVEPLKTASNMMTPCHKPSSTPCYKPSSTPLRKSPRTFLNSLSWNSRPKKSGLLESSEGSAKSVKDQSILAASLSGYSASGTLNSESHIVSRRSSLQKTQSNPGTTSHSSSSCNCYGANKVCSVCLKRRNQHAPRSGTPGFRAPEVLLRHPDQTTAVDMWSAGVILLSLLSGCYPFFNAVDDLASLAEITTLLGTKAVKKASANLGKLFTTNQALPALDLRKICLKLRNQTKNTIEEKDQTRDSVDCKGCHQAASECVCIIERSSLPHARNNGCTLKSQIAFKSPHVPARLTSQTEVKDVDKFENQSSFPHSLFNLLIRLLDPNPDTRISAKDSLSHPFILQYSKR